MSWKTENTQFLTALNQFVLGNMKKSFKEAHLDAKIYWISSATPWNSTIIITLLIILMVFVKHLKYIFSLRRNLISQQGLKSIQNIAKEDQKTLRIVTLCLNAKFAWLVHAFNFFRAIRYHTTLFWQIKIGRKCAP